MKKILKVYQPANCKVLKVWPDTIDEGNPTNIIDAVIKLETANGSLNAFVPNYRAQQWKDVKVGENVAVYFSAYVMGPTATWPLPFTKISMKRKEIMQETRDKNSERSWGTIFGLVTAKETNRGKELTIIDSVVPVLFFGKHDEVKVGNWVTARIRLDAHKPSRKIEETDDIDVALRS